MKIKPNKQRGEATLWFIIGVVWVVHGAFVLGYMMLPPKTQPLNPIQEHAAGWQSPFPK